MIYSEWKSKVDFTLIYIREAHPDDGWQVPANKRDNIIVNDPKTIDERKKVALDFAKQFTIKIPTFVDTMDDKASKLFAAWPDRIYVLERDGKVCYRGGLGPAGFKPSEVPPVLRSLTSP